MVTRYGTAELFGYNFSGLTPQKIREFSAAHYKEIPCPFKPIAPGKPIPTCSKKGGVCSLRQYSRHADGTVAPIGPPVTTCPQRFLEQNLVFEWVGEILLGNPLPVVISEVPFLMSETEVPTEAQPSLARTRLQIRLVAKLKTAAETSETFCKAEVERMLKNSQTKVIMPVVALGLLKTFSTTGRSLFSDTE